jgi:hypothetical protein
MNLSNSFKVTLVGPNSKLTATSAAESMALELSIGLAVFFTRAIKLQNENQKKINTRNKSEQASK